VVGGQEMSLPAERMFPHRWMREIKALRGRDMLVWWYLSQRQGKSPFIRTSMADISGWCRISEKSAERSIRTLIAAEMLSVESGQAIGKANSYTVLVPDRVRQYDGASGTSQVTVDRGVRHHDGEVRHEGPGGPSMVDPGKDFEVNLQGPTKFSGVHDLDQLHAPGQGQMLEEPEPDSDRLSLAHLGIES
jgi:hypothetical protein